MFAILILNIIGSVFSATGTDYKNLLESINQRENKDTSILYAYNNYLDLASYTGHVGGGKVDRYPQFAHANDSWGIIYHSPQTFSLLHINLHKSADFLI